MEEINTSPLVKPRRSSTETDLANNKRMFFAITLALLFIITIFFMFISKGANQQLTPTPSPTTIPTVTQYPLPTITQSKRLNQLQKTAPGEKINQEALEKQTSFISKENVDENKAQYSFRSYILQRPNVVIVSSESIVTFERQLLPESPKAPGYTTFAQLKTKHGEAEKVIKGSKFYDWYIETHIYASKGFTAIGNPNTDEVYEMHFFIPSSVDEYTQTYGEDLSPGETPLTEGLR